MAGALHLRSNGALPCVRPRVLEEMFLANGARIGYWRGSIEGVIDDLQVTPLTP